MKHFNKALSLIISLGVVAVTTAKAQLVQKNFANEKAEILCTYRLSYQPDSSDITQRIELMRLVIGKSTSMFESQGAYLSDSIEVSMADLPDNQANTQLLVDKISSLPHSRFSFKIFKNRASNTMYPYDSIGTKLYTYVDKFPVAGWKMRPEKTVIAGYNCQKATISFGGRVFEAWFSREIPVTDGPYKFYGLPGLIVKLRDTRNQYIFELIKLKQLHQTLTIALPKQATLTTKPALQKGKQNYYANLPNVAAALTSQGNQNTPDVQASERKRIAKKFNNSLEIR